MIGPHASSSTDPWSRAALLVESARGLGKDPTIDRAASGSLKQAGRPGPEGAHLPAVHTAIGLVAYCVR